MAYLEQKEKLQSIIESSAGMIPEELEKAKIMITESRTCEGLLYITLFTEGKGWDICSNANLPEDKWEFLDRLEELYYRMEDGYPPNR